MIMVCQRKAVEQSKQSREDRRGKVALMVVVALILTADTIVNWAVPVV